MVPQSFVKEEQRGTHQDGSSLLGPWPAKRGTTVVAMENRVDGEGEVKERRFGEL